MPFRVTYTVNYGVVTGVRRKKRVTYQSRRITRFYKYEGHARRWASHWKEKIRGDAQRDIDVGFIQKGYGWKPVGDLIVGEEIVEVGEKGVNEYVHEYH